MWKRTARPARTPLSPFLTMRPNSFFQFQKVLTFFFKKIFGRAMPVDMNAAMIVASYSSLVLPLIDNRFDLVGLSVDFFDGAAFRSGRSGIVSVVWEPSNGLYLFMAFCRLL